ncbi:ribokinase, partial [Staphylococcus epidermidis]
IIEGTNTGTFIVVLDENGQNTMLGTLGANSKMGLNNITKVFSSTTSKYFLLQLETSKESILHALKLAKKKGITVVLD